MLKELEIGKLYRFKSTGKIAAVTGIDKKENNTTYYLHYLDDPHRVYLFPVYGATWSQDMSVWEEV